MALANANEPFAATLKQFFSQHKQMGSNDRKAISSLCYAFFRVAANNPKQSFLHNLAVGLFLTQYEPSNYLQILNAGYNTLIKEPLQQKLSASGLTELNLFPFKNLLSKQIDADKFELSFLQQPKLYLRARPGKQTKVFEAVAQASVKNTPQLSGDCITLPNGLNMQLVGGLNRDFVIQDKSSQRVLEDLPVKAGAILSAWDCCAASGGKSILLYDKLLGQVKLTLTDVRQHILAQAKKRLQQARIPIDFCVVADVSNGAFEHEDLFDIIVCDAPCTGSGTWARTPEQLSIFTPQNITKYTTLQSKIVTQAWAKLKPGGHFVYITCSVFDAENEDISEILSGLPGAKILTESYKKGYEQKADTLFTSVFTKN